MTRKHFLNIGLMAVLALAASCACKKTPEVKTHKPVSKVESDIEDESLPEAGALERYSPSAKSTFYHPIYVDCWPNTKYVPGSAEYVSMKTRVIANMPDFTADQTIDTYRQSTNGYGSSTELPKQTATGRFYVKKIDGRWWIVDPEGCLHHHRGVNSVRPGEKSERQKAAFKKLYGSSLDTWINTAAIELREIGFHAVGAFTPDNAKDAIMSYNASHKDSPVILCPSFEFLKTFKSQNGCDYPNGNEKCRIGLVLDTKWEEWCKTYVESALKKYKGDPNVLGIFSDNEIEFISADNSSMLKLLLNDESTKASVKKWCAENGINPDSSSQIGLGKNNNKFAGYLAELYYEGVSKAIKAYDPGMLYLGSRIHGNPRLTEEIFKAAGKYCDIISVNYYGDWSADLAENDGDRAPGKASRGHVTLWEEWSGGKPYMITEFYTKGIEDSELENQHGAGFAVRNQASRAYAYQHFTLGLLEAPNIVGWHWFRYQDDDGTDNDGQLSNKGIYDNDLQIYEYLGRYMRNLNIHAYDLIEYFDAAQ